MGDILARKSAGAFTQQAALPTEEIQAAIPVLESGRLYRYSLLPGETGEEAALEAEYCERQGSGCCLALSSSGHALQRVMRACGREPGDIVLTNAFMLATVPGAIAAVGGRAALVEITEDLRSQLAGTEGSIRAWNALYAATDWGLSEAGRIGPIARPAGLLAVWLEDADRMLTAIKMIKAHGATPDALEILSNAANELTRNGANLLFVACLELSLMTHGVNSDVPVIDTVDVLATAIRNHTTTEES